MIAPLKVVPSGDGQYRFKAYVAFGQKVSDRSGAAMCKRQEICRGENCAQRQP